VLPEAMKNRPQASRRLTDSQRAVLPTRDLLRDVCGGQRGTGTIESASVIRGPQQIVVPIRQEGNYTW
jgi:hypothetical protein